MIISNLEHLEVVTEENNIEGGRRRRPRRRSRNRASASNNSVAKAFGSRTNTYTDSNTIAVTGNYFSFSGSSGYSEATTS